MHASTLGFARVAATGPSSRAAPPVSLAVTHAARLTGSNMARGGPKVSAAAAVDQPMTAGPGVAHAPSSRPGAIGGRMPAAEKRYARRRARRLCTDCGQPSHGASRCEPCARRAYVRSGEHRGLPIYPPLLTVVEIATEENHGTFDSWEEVAMCLAFARLSIEEVEIISDQSPMTTCTGY